MSINPLNDLSKVYLENVSESAVPGKPAERLGAVTGIPKSEQEAAKERLLKKAAAKRAAMKTEALDPVGQEDADIDNDGDTDKSDKYLHKRRKAIAKAMKKRVKEERELAEIHKQAHMPHEIPDKNLKKLVAKAVKRIDTDVDGDTDHNDKAKGELGEFIPGVGNKRLYSTTGTKTAKESFSNWRQDLSEVITDESDKQIKEKKIKNKVVINPKLGEAVEEIGGTLLEMIEVDEFDYVVEEVYLELIEEGFSEDEIEYGIETALKNLEEGYYDSAVATSASKAKSSEEPAPKKSLKDRLKSVAKKAIYGTARAAGEVVKKKEQIKGAAEKVKTYSSTIKKIAKAGYKSGRGPVEKTTTYRGAGVGRKEKIGEEVVDEGIKGERNVMRKLASKERAAERKEKGGAAAKMPGRLGKSAGDSYADYQQVSIAAHDKVTKKNKNVVGLVTKEQKEEETQTSNAPQKVDPQTQQMLARKKQMLQKQQMLDKQRLQLQRQGKLPVGHAMEEVEQVDEKLNLKKEKMGDVIKDFYKSDAPQFKGKSKEKRREMAIAAKLTAERGGSKLGEEIEIEEGMSLKDFKANRKKNERRAASADAEKRGHVGKEWHNTGRKYSPDEAKSRRAKMSDDDRAARHRAAVDPDDDRDENTYSASKTKDPKKLRKQAAMGEETINERTRYAKETGKDFTTGKPSEKGGTLGGDDRHSKVMRYMQKNLRKSGGMMSSRKNPIQPQGKKKEKGTKGYEGQTPVDKIKAKLAKKRAPKPDLGSRYD